jgi:hypothetical protein
MVQILEELQRLLLRAQNWQAETTEESQRLDAEYQWAQNAYHRRVTELKRSLVTYEWPDKKVENMPQFQDQMKVIGAPPVFEKPVKAANPFLRMIHSTLDGPDFPAHVHLGCQRYDIKWNRIEEALARVTVLLANERYNQSVSVHNMVSNPIPIATSLEYTVPAERGSIDSAP